MTRRPGRVSGSRTILFGIAAVLLIVPAFVVAAPIVVGTSPSDQAVGVPLDAEVAITFAAPIDVATATDASLLVSSSMRGPVSGAVTWETATNSLRFQPDEPFLTGERVNVTLTSAVTDLLGQPLRGGHHVQFSAWTAPVAMSGFTPSKQAWSTGSVSVNATIADLDGDRIPEVIFSNAVPDSLTILTSDGAGGFTTLARFETGILPRHTIAADVDGNGYVDLITCASGPNEIDVFLNQGGGALSPPVSYQTGETPYGAFSGDLDADGDLDVVTANFNSHDLSILENVGGSFLDPVSASAGPSADSPRWVDGADFDGDGDLDLACCNGYSYDVSVFLNDGTGVLTVQTPLLPVGESPNFLEARDFDGDGLVDLVTVNAEGTLSFLAGNGDGTFDAAVASPVGGSLPYGIQVVDLDGDFDLDVLVPVRGTNDWRWMRNDGAGDFTAAQALPGGNHCHTIGAADWDADGDIDVVAGFMISGDMFFYEHQIAPGVVSTDPPGNATNVPLGSAVTLTFATDLTPASATPQAFQIHGAQSGPHEVSVEWVAASQAVVITPEDPFLPGELVSVTVDGTGMVESVNGVPHEGHALEFLTWAAAAPASFTPTTISLPGTDPVGLVASDLDEDGASDLVVANFLSGDVTLLLTQGSGSPHVAGTVPVGVGPIDLWAGDLDGNGSSDVAVVNVVSSTVSILFNQGDGVLVAGPVLGISGAPFAITGGDFDRDGDRDLATAAIDPGNVTILWNSGTGSFPAVETIFINGAPLDVAAADLDSDGDLDLAAADSENHRIRIFKFDGSFVSVGTFGTGTTPVGVFPWDTNGDGLVDLVSADYGNGGISVLENLGDAVFAPAFSLPSNDLPRGIAGADLTGDGTLELFSANSGGADVTVFRNLGDGVFDGGASVAVGATPYAVVAGDLDADQRVDLAVVNRTSGDLTLLMNVGATGVEVLSSADPVEGLISARPNPFTSRVTIELGLARASHVALRVYDLHGRAIATLHDGSLPAGRHEVTWDARDHSGHVAAAGVYFLRMDAAGGGWSRKLLRLK